MKKEERKEVVVMTGASAGVGRATVREFAKAGAKIGLIARGVDGLEAAKREVEQMGGEAIIMPLDVADAQEIEDAAQKVETAFGPIDIWVNDAMVSVFSPFKDMTPDEFHRVTEVTYLGVVYGTMAALRRMLPRDKGSIVQVGSALSYRSIPLQSAYCGAKHGIRGFTDSIRSELLHDKSRVHITMVQLPALNTTQFGWVKSRLKYKAQPVPPIFQPEVAAQAIFWAAHHKRREIFVGWPTVKAMWGNKFIPGLLDGYLARNGYSSQQTDVPDNPGRPNNLFEPLPGDWGAHGGFDDMAKKVSVQSWLDLNFGRLGLGFLAGGILALGALAGKRAIDAKRAIDQDLRGAA